jgi:tetratricopeptide (TPR) repeat protein
LAERSERVSGAIFVGVVLLGASALVYGTIEYAALTLAKRSVIGGRPGVETAARLSPLNWSFPLVLAEVAASTGRREVAVAWYHAALRLNPACATCALGLADVEAKLGRDPVPWIDRAVRYGRSTAAVRMRAGTMYAQLGLQERAADEFRAAALGQRENQREFFALLHRIYPDSFVLERILPDALVAPYFGFARTQLDPASVRSVWQRYVKLGAPPAAREDYVAYLLRYGFAHEAWMLAFDGHPPPLGTLLNGDFEAPVSGRGLSWRITDAAGVKARVRDCADCVDGGRALWIGFDGQTNVQYSGARLYVPVAPSTVYRLSARVKGDEISSARGPALAVRGLAGPDPAAAARCELHVVGEELRRSFDWRTTSLLFTTPPSCEGVAVMIARPATRRLDKFVGGELWVDDVRLEALVAAPAIDPTAQAGPGQAGVAATALEGSGPEPEIEPATR